MVDRQADNPPIPRVGMLATVRNRRALIASVEPFGGGPKRLNLVTLEYTDPDGIPQETIIWEREISPSVLEPTALPQVATEPPMLSADFDALQRSTRRRSGDGAIAIRHECLDAITSAVSAVV